MSASTAKTPSKKRRLDTLGLLRTEISEDLMPGVLTGVFAGTPR